MTNNTTAATQSHLEIDVENGTHREFRCISRQVQDKTPGNHPSWLGSKSEENEKRVIFLRRLTALDMPVRILGIPNLHLTSLQQTLITGTSYRS